MDTNTDNTDTKALFIEAKRLYDAREYVQALPKLQSLLEHEPDNVPALIWSADILCEFRHWEKSLSVAQHALAIEPKNPLLLSLMSKVLHHLSDFDGSVRYAKRAYKLAPTSRVALKCYVSALTFTKDFAAIAKIAPRLLATKDIEGDNIAAVAFQYISKIPESIRALRAGIRRFLATTKSPPPRNPRGMRQWSVPNKLCLESRACSIPLACPFASRMAHCLESIAMAICCPAILMSTSCSLGAWSASGSRAS